MTLLGSINNLIDDENENSNDVYTTPAVIREDKEEFTLKKALAFSTLLHPLTVGLIWAISILLMFMGIKFSFFEKPKPKVNDIEFVLVDKEDVPRNKNTRNRADINSRSGGKNDPKRPVSMPS